MKIRIRKFSFVLFGRIKKWKVSPRMQIIDVHLFIIFKNYIYLMYSCVIIRFLVKCLIAIWLSGAQGARVHWNGYEKFKDDKVSVFCNKKKFFCEYYCYSCNGKSFIWINSLIVVVGVPLYLVDLKIFFERINELSIKWYFNFRLVRARSFTMQ